MAKLRELLRANLYRERKDLKGTEYEGIITEYEEIILDKLEREIKQEVISEEAKLLVDAADKEQILRSIEKLKEMFWTVVIIGVLVGVTGNQITELISSLKEGFNIFWTVLLVIILILAMYFYFWVRYLNQATDEIRKFKENSRK